MTTTTVWPNTTPNSPQTNNRTHKNSPPTSSTYSMRTSTSSLRNPTSKIWAMIGACSAPSTKSDWKIGGDFYAATRAFWPTPPWDNSSIGPNVKRVDTTATVLTRSTSSASQLWTLAWYFDVFWCERGNMFWKTIVDRKRARATNTIQGWQTILQPFNQAKLKWIHHQIQM